MLGRQRRTSHQEGDPLRTTTPSTQQRLHGAETSHNLSPDSPIWPHVKWLNLTEPLFPHLKVRRGLGCSDICLALSNIEKSLVTCGGLSKVLEWRSGDGSVEGHAVTAHPAGQFPLSSQSQPAIHSSPLKAARSRAIQTLWVSLVRGRFAQSFAC